MAFFLGLAKGIDKALDRKWDREKFYTALAEKRRSAAAARGAASEKENKMAKRALAYVTSRLRGGEGENALSPEAVRSLSSWYNQDPEALIYTYEQMSKIEAERGSRITGKEFAQTAEIVTTAGEESGGWLDDAIQSGEWGVPEATGPLFIDIDPSARESGLDYSNSDVNNLISRVEDVSDRMIRQDLASGNIMNTLQPDNEAERIQLEAAMNEFKAGRVDDAVGRIKNITESTTGMPAYNVLATEFVYENANREQRQILENDMLFKDWWETFKPEKPEVGEIERRTVEEAPKTERPSPVAEPTRTPVPEAPVGSESRVAPSPTPFEVQQQPGILTRPNTAPVLQPYDPNTLGRT